MKAKLNLTVDSPFHLFSPAWPATWANQYNTLVRQVKTGDNRWGMQAAMLNVQGNIIAPVALLIFQYYDFGYQDYFADIAAVLFLGVLVANLALLPVRLTRTIFWTNLAIHPGLVVCHFI